MQDILKDLDHHITTEEPINDMEIDGKHTTPEDKRFIWRTKGRLENSMLNWETKNPIFIAPDTPLADLVIRDTHGPYHRRIEHTIATVRSEYWIPKLCQQVRKLVQKCVKCRRFNSLPYQYPSTTDLPHRRVQTSRAFQHIGVDFFDLPSSTATMDNNEFERLQRNYNLLRNAIPPLPSPEELYPNITRVCQRFKTTVRSISSLDERIREVRTSEETWAQRSLSQQLLKVTIDKTKLELTLIRMQLKVWEAMMNRPQFDDEDRPLLIDYSQINAAISDQLELRSQHQDNIKQIRNNLLLENQKEEKSFRDRVMQEFKVLENLLTTMERHPVVLNWDAFDMDFFARIAVLHNRGPEGVNARPDLGDAVDVDSTGSVSANVDNAVRDVDADDADADDVGADADIEHRELDQHDAARRRQGIVDQGPDDRDVIEELFLRLRRTSQERDDLQMMINELESQERCAPRRYREGIIRRRDEFGMPCVFCEAPGHHYSDSCTPASKTWTLRNAREYCAKLDAANNAWIVAAKVETIAEKRTLDAVTAQKRGRTRRSARCQNEVGISKINSKSCGVTTKTLPIEFSGSGEG
ncbi:unnamed protein product [Heligmosomoides polygyrus]|uniref:Integrase_H2C2 domain-containing protein n=1 Tax=Heligmosomoides polygyrus TaxID=6339 RepID=A0A183G4L4_HELPZ|nr:unnamed protein product [Heligmosomoides polygyrus]